MIKPHITEAQKIQAIRAVKEEGLSVSVVSKALGVHRASVYRWLDRKASKKSLSREKNPLSGRQPTISGKTGRELIKILKKPASFFGYDSDLWNTTRIRQVLKKKLKIKISKSALHRTLLRFKYAFKTPEKRYDQARPQEQAEWRDKTVPEIQKTVKKNRAILYFVDEASLNLAPSLGKTWAPKGKPTIQKVTGARGSVAAISAISQKGNLLFNLFEGSKRFNGDDIIHFLTQLLQHHPRRHIVAILDRAPCHRSQKVRDFVSQHLRLEIFYLPAYSPELNPDEQVWSHLKHQELKSHKARNQKELKKLASAKLKKMAKDNRMMKGIFFRSEGSQFFV